jgi:hypothetical protein
LQWLVSTGSNIPYSAIRVLRESRRSLDNYIEGSVWREERTKEISGENIYIYIFSEEVSKDHRKRKSYYKRVLL